VSLAQGTQGWNITNADYATGVTFYGSALNDRLQGGNGDDILTGGDGKDTFVVYNKLLGHDIITDFHMGEDDLDTDLMLTWDDIKITDSEAGTLYMSETDGSSLMVYGYHFPKPETDEARITDDLLG
jgi:hypothetical protein